MTAPPCFAIEHDPDDPRCQECPVFQPCGKVVQRHGLVRLSHITYALVPDKLDDRIAPTWTNPTGQLAQRIWPKLYWKLMGRPTDQGLNKETAVKIEANALACGLGVDAFMTVHLTLHIQTRPNDSFWASMMAGPAAVRTTMEWMQAVKEKTGSATADSLRNLLRQDSAETFEQSILASEVLFGSQVVNYRMKKSNSDREMLAEIFAERETAWHPTWLAMDDHYMNLVIRSNPEEIKANGFPTSLELEKHRHRVARERAKMIRSRSLARLVWETREAMAPKAVDRVIRQLGWTPDWFELKPDPVKEMLWLWNRIALALQQYGALELASPSHL